MQDASNKKTIFFLKKKEQQTGHNSDTERNRIIAIKNTSEFYKN